MRRRLNNKASLPATFEGMKSDYAAAKHSRFRRRRTGIVSMGSGADYHYRNEADYLRMMEVARDMDRNDAVIGHLLDTSTLNTIQDGLMPDPQTGDAEADEALLERFLDWATDPLQCSLDGTKTFSDQQELVFRATQLDGDIMALPTSEGSLDMVEAHRCRTPTNTTRNVVHGVLLDEHRRRLEYWFTKDEIDPNMPLSRVGEIEQYPAYDEDGFPNVLHVFNPKRFSQTRGVTALAPVFDTAGMFEDIQFAKLVQQQVVSCFALIREMEMGAENAGDPRLGNQEADTYADGARKLIEQIAPGMEVTGNPGEKISGFSPNVPNAGAMEHFKLMLTLLGVNLGIPLVLLTMDASETNFSGWRGAMDQARMGFRRNQRWLIDHFLRPVYRWKVRQWTHADTGEPRLVALANKLRAEGNDIFGHKWTAPKWPYVQPLQDAQADELRVKARQTSPRRQLAERGMGIDEVHAELIEDNFWLIKRAIDASAKLKRATGVDVHWRALLYVANEIELKPGLPSAPNTSEESDAPEAMNGNSRLNGRLLGHD